MILLDSKNLQAVSNNPVHLMDEDGQLMPTALVPFCAFSNNFSTMGVKIDQFDVPVCKIFRAKLYQDQLCYEADFNEFKKNLGSKDEISVSFFIHYNEDRMLSMNSNDRTNFEKDRNVIIVNTIGKKQNDMNKASQVTLCFLFCSRST